MKEEAAMEAVKEEEHVRVEVASDPLVEKEDRVVRARMIMGR